MMVVPGGPAIPVAPPRADRRARSVVLPLTLIVLGSVLLLENLGLLPGSAWALLARLWPLILIGFGIELLIGRRSGAGQIVLVLVLLVATAAAAALSRFAVGTAGPNASRQIEQPVAGATDAAVDLSFDAGTLRVGALEDDADRLAATTYEGPDRLAPRVEYDVRDGHGSLRYAPSASGRRGPFGFLDPGVRPASLSVDLTPRIPLTLEVHTGAADARLDLTRLNVRQIFVDVGASQTWLRLPDAAGATSARVRSGAANVAIEVPEGVAAEIRYQGGVSRLTVDEARFPPSDVAAPPGVPPAPPAPAPPAPPASAADRASVPPAPPAPAAPAAPPPPEPFGGRRIYRSPDYATAANRVALTIESGASSVSIR